MSFSTFSLTGNINIYGMTTLYIKEVMRFVKVYNQTLFAPVITALLLLAVFSLALGERVHTIEHIPFHQFMAPGLIMMVIVQNAFANTSSSFVMGKVLGHIIDYLMPPISAGEMCFAMVLAGVTRGICVGILVALAMLIFIDLSVYHIGYILFHAVAASALLALLGMLGGILSESFDQMSAITSYVITPLSFLSGTFYSVKNLPEFWHIISQWNPFFYMIDGFRYGMTGYHDGNIATGIIALLLTIIFLWFTIWYLLQKGYRIKS